MAMHKQSFFSAIGSLTHGSGTENSEREYWLFCHKSVAIPQSNFQSTKSFQPVMQYYLYTMMHFSHTSMKAADLPLPLSSNPKWVKTQGPALGPFYIWLEDARDFLVVAPQAQLFLFDDKDLLQGFLHLHLLLNLACSGLICSIL